MKKEMIQFDDIMKLDLRVGHVESASQVENSKKLLELVVNFGEDYGTVTVLTGMAMFYTPEDFAGKSFAFIANLAPKEMAGKTSNGMIVAVDSPDKPFLMEVPTTIAPGTIIR